MLNQRDLQDLEQAARLIITVIERYRIADENAVERRMQFRLVGTEEKKEEAKRGIIKFTKKEIETMPLYYKNLFFHNDVVARWRQRSGNLIEIRCQINGKKITASGKTKEAAAEKFIKKLNTLERAKDGVQNVITFAEYASKWLETIKKPNVKEKTYEYYLSLFRAQLFPVFGKKALSEIKQFDVQAFLNGLLAEGKSRTAHKHLQVLKSLFEYAEADDIITKSPMRLVKLPYHEEEHGVALTYEEEREFVARCIDAGTRTGKAFVFMLYTGLRRSELATVNIENEFIVVKSAKQRIGRKEKTRSIPISPRLRKVLPNLEEDLPTFKDLYMNRVSRTFKEWLPNHHLHELRHTFITRAQECGISRELVSVWAGHKADNTMTSKVYTHFSADYQMKEMQKFDYEFTPNFTPNF